MRYEVIFDKEVRGIVTLRCNGRTLEDVKTREDFCEWLQESLVMFELIYEDDFITVHRTVNS